MGPARLIAVVFLLLIALAHVLRLVLGVEITINQFIVPMWVSVLAAVGPGGLALWLARERRTAP
jgi:hypothetical protein